MALFTEEIISKALSFEEFKDYSKKIVDKEIEKPPYTDPFYYDYTVSNLKRADKILQNVQLNKKLYNELSEGFNNWTWIVFDEPWCGDASFSVPLLKAMEIASGGEINFKILLRDENKSLMEHYLTNGGEAIPKLVCLDENLNELGTWGPRPKALQDLVLEWKEEGIELNEKLKRVHIWYRKDNGKSIQKEFIDLIKSWK